MKVNREKYFEVLDFINEVNNRNFRDLDLSEFFLGLTKDKKDFLREKYGNINNYNLIYLLSSQEHFRKEHGVELSKPKENEN